MNSTPEPWLLRGFSLADKSEYLLHCFSYYVKIDHEESERR